jgi:pyruvate-formate lyase-activating enzyme
MSTTPRTTHTSSRAAVRLGFDCDNECVFCAQVGLTGRAESIREQLAELRDEHDEVTFIGGEPTLDPRLLTAIADARSLGYTAIGLQTNARSLAGGDGGERFAALVDAGLSDLQLSIHAPTAEAHDYHTGHAGSFAACIDLIARAQRADITTVVVTVVTRSNFRELAKLPPMLKRHGVAAWLLEVVRPHGRAADNFARVVPRIGMAMPWALHALEQARRHALSAWIRGAPLCALGPFAVSSLETPGRNPSRPVPADWPPPCQACPSRPRCPGLDSAYVEVFGHGELRPVPGKPVEFDDGRRRLMRMFVGVGELVVRPPQLYSPEPDSAEPPQAQPSKNLRLPVLGNVATPEE